MVFFLNSAKSHYIEFRTILIKYVHILIFYNTKRLIITSGVTQIRFHDFRHTHASILIAKGVDVVKVSKRLGHANAKITLETYAHLVPNEDNDLADIFEKELKKVSWAFCEHWLKFEVLYK